MEELKACIKKYQKIDNELQELNKSIYTLREERKMLELEIADFMKLPQFAGVDKLKIEEDGSVIQVKRPGWSKPWSMSKKDLSELLEDYFAKFIGVSAEKCVNFIIEEKKKTSISQEYSFTRVIPE
jgi:hypothetical protein